ncbi:MAG: FAD-dependent oxidoreductase [SAR324 cluster bacterium]|nr:FAD-dependent oxidoreductase [SAR324 cluster bacterium]MBF0349415.1 FAD-dependent oxidoreductase [SAR324 cluster bacterium]
MENILEINEAQYEEVVLNGGLVAFDFYSTECPPCEALASKFHSLHDVYGHDIKFVKIFRQGNRELANKLGVNSSPTLLFYKDGQLIGKKLTGGIKRAEIMENLDSMIGTERARELKSGIKPFETECDVLILGAGPAGLTAGIYTAQAKLKTIIVDIGLAGGQVSKTHLVSNFPGFTKPIEGFMLMHNMNEQAVEAGVERRYAVDVTHADLEKKEIIIDGVETIRAKKIIVATGSTHRLLGVPGEEEYKGDGISYCATCDGKYFQDKEVVVIGGGNSAVEESLFITKFATKVTIVHQFATLQANKLAQEKAFANEKIEFILEHEPRKFEKTPTGMDVTVEDLKTRQLKTLSTHGVFIFAGMKPNIDLFGDRFEKDQWGYIKTDVFMRTTVKDVFAVGDVANNPYRQITVAVSDGTKAAITATREIDDAA